MAFRRRVSSPLKHDAEQGSGDSNYSHREGDFDLEDGNRETLRRDAERQAALQLERAKVSPLSERKRMCAVQTGSLRRLHECGVRRVGGRRLAGARLCCLLQSEGLPPYQGGLSPFPFKVFFRSSTMIGGLAVW